MPTRPLRPCNAKPRCPTLHRNRSGYCDQHARPAWAGSTRKPWAHTKDRHARGYGTDWVKLRKQVLTEQPRCQIRIACDGAPSKTADHIIPKSKGGTDDRENLQGACWACHKAKSSREGHAARLRKQRAERPTSG